MRRLVALFLSVGAVLFVGARPQREAAEQAEASQPEHVLKSYHAFMRTLPVVEVYFDFLEDVEKESNGRIKFENLGGPEAISPAESLSALRRGAVDIATVPFAFWPKELGALLSTYAYPGPTFEIYTKSGATEIMDSMMRQKVGLRYLAAVGGADSWVLLSRERVTTASYKGMRIRSFPLTTPAVQALGGTPVSTPMAERYAALERGVVDAALVPAQDAVLESLYEPADFVIMPGLYPLRNQIVITDAAMSKLPEDLQELIVELSGKWEAIAYERNAAETKKSMNILQKEAEIIELPDTEAQALRSTAIDTLWAEMGKVDPTGVQTLRPILDRAWQKAR
jgi:TRAP-type C4-dicarboxylate transport system substrate-binding protein